MLHLMLVGSDLACASHGASGGPAMAAMVMPDAPAHEGGAHATAAMTAMPDDHATAQAAQDCATPTQNRCCEAMSSCGVTTMVSAVRRPAVPVLSPDAAPLHASNPLVSVLQAPEPPPPKA